jgi:hypothetical protein
MQRILFVAAVLVHMAILSLAGPLAAAPPTPPAPPAIPTPPANVGFNKYQVDDARGANGDVTQIEFGTTGNDMRRVE